jgi:ribosome biogenesis GTPase
VLETIGYDAATAASFAPWDAADASVGRVARVDRGVLTVLTETGPHRVSLSGRLLSRVAADPAAAPCLGDWVVVRSWPDRRETVEHVLPRRTSLVPGYGDPTHAPVAANVDLVAVVVDLSVAEPRPSELRRLLEMAGSSGAMPLVVLTGAGRPAPRPGPAGLGHAPADTEVLQVDVSGGPGLERLRELVGGRRTLVLVGATGAATGRVARALVGADVIGGRGSKRGLAVLPGGGAVLDLRRPPAPSAGGWTQKGAP